MKVRETEHSDDEWVGGPGGTLSPAKDCKIKRKQEVKPSQFKTHFDGYLSKT